MDIYHVHQWDGLTPLEETLETLDLLVRSGKVRYLGVSNYSGWQLMKALCVADTHGCQRFVSNQIYYSLESRDAEYELVPLSLDQGLGIMVWSRWRADCSRASTGVGRTPPTAGISRNGPSPPCATRTSCTTPSRPLSTSRPA